MAVGATVAVAAATGVSLVPRVAPPPLVVGEEAVAVGAAPGHEAIPVDDGLTALAGCLAGAAHLAHLPDGAEAPIAGDPAPRADSLEVARESLAATAAAMRHRGTVARPDNVERDLAKGVPLDTRVFLEHLCSPIFRGVPYPAYH